MILALGPLEGSTLYAVIVLLALSMGIQAAESYSSKAVESPTRWNRNFGVQTPNLQ
jgi:hypothetical protein